MDLLKEGVYLRSYANKDPLIEYKRESFILFESLIGRIQENVTKRVYNTFVLTQKQMDSMLNNANLSHEDISAFLQAQQNQNQSVSVPPGFGSPSHSQERPILKPVHVMPKVGRNDPCPCGSGKKYKKCCGVNDVSDD